MLLPISLCKTSGCLAALWKLMLTILLEFRFRGRFFLAKLEREKPVFCPVFFFFFKCLPRGDQGGERQFESQFTCKSPVLMLYPQQLKPYRTHT